MMDIHTTLLNGNGSDVDTTAALFDYAVTILGDNWAHTASGNAHKLLFDDPTGSGTHGWISDPNNTILNNRLTMISNGVSYGNINGERISVFGAFDVFTGLVWQSDGGSVGIGYKNDNGRYVTWFMLIKLNGQYNGSDVYAVAYNRTFNSQNTAGGSILVHGVSDIRPFNECGHNNWSIGSGIYLQSLYDPISGLVASDIYGARSMPSDGYSESGTIIVQGGTSYLTVLGGPTGDKNPRNSLFVRM